MIVKLQHQGSNFHFLTTFWIVIVVVFAKSSNHPWPWKQLVNWTLSAQFFSNNILWFASFFLLQQFCLYKLLQGQVDISSDLRRKCPANTKVLTRNSSEILDHPLSFFNVTNILYESTWELSFYIIIFWFLFK